MTRTGGSAATRGMDEQFLELLCADEDLLRAEFDAIIAAEWPSPPPAEPDRGAGAERRPRPARLRRAASTAALPSRPRHPRIGGWTRQRAPPPGETSRNRAQERAGDRPTWFFLTRRQFAPARTFHHPASDAHRAAPAPERRTHLAGRTDSQPHTVVPAARRPGPQPRREPDTINQARTDRPLRRPGTHPGTPARRSSATPTGPSGEFDLATAGALGSLLSRLLEHAQCLVIDVSAVSFHCAGLRPLLTAAATAERLQVDVTLRGQSPALGRLVTVMDRAGLARPVLLARVA